MVDKNKCELNQDGYLPQKRFEITLNEFKEFFVFRKIEKKRIKLFSKYEDFCKRFDKIILKLWIDGSYTTNKFNPGDIDVAVHYDALKFNNLVELDINEKRIFNDREYIKDKYSIHLLPVPVYPPDHKKYRMTIAASERWNELFLEDNRKNPPVKKGYVEIINEDRIS